MYRISTNPRGKGWYYVQAFSSSRAAFFLELECRVQPRHILGAVKSFHAKKYFRISARAVPRGLRESRTNLLEPHRSMVTQQTAPPRAASMCIIWLHVGRQEVFNRPCDLWQKYSRSVAPAQTSLMWVFYCLNIYNLPSPARRGRIRS